jgi:hypothetical protein
MFSHVLCSATAGVRACIVWFETRIDHRIPAIFKVVGLSDHNAKESRDRVFVGMKTTAFRRAA